MQHFLAIAETGLTSLRLHPLRSLVTVAALVAVLLPFLAGLGIARGLQDQAEAAFRLGPDLYVSGEQFGRPKPVPAALADEIRALPGVAEVVPRAVGRVELGAERVAAIVVGVPLDKFPATLDCIEGGLYGDGAGSELVIGSDLARRLKLSVGALIPPFYHNRRGEHVSKVVGVFRSDISFWQAGLIVTSFETAGRIFAHEGQATELLVWCLPGYEADVGRTILRALDPTGEAGLRVAARGELHELLSQRVFEREGVFSALFALGFAVAILVILVTSGFGLAERRREIGILKATGWQTDQVLLRSLIESFLISLAGASLAIVLAVIWLKAFNGYGIAGVFLTGVDAAPGGRVPFRLTPTPALLALLIAFVVVMSGSLYSTWRAAIAPPREAMR
jgi:ABC-type lipoprotein release transport system permease subunit